MDSNKWGEGGMKKRWGKKIAQLEMMRYVVIICKTLKYKRVLEGCRRALYNNNTPPPPPPTTIIIIQIRQQAGIRPRSPHPHPRAL